MVLRWGFLKNRKVAKTRLKRIEILDHEIIEVKISKYDRRPKGSEGGPKGVRGGSEGGPRGTERSPKGV